TEVSFTTKVVLQLFVFLAASETKMVTVVMPDPTIEPGAGLCALIKEPDGVQLSVAVTPDLKSGTGAWQLLFALLVWFGAHAVIAGGEVSRTTKVVAHVFVFLAESET